MKQQSPETLRQQIIDSRPTALVFELYDTTIALLNDAIGSIDRNDIEGRCNSINLATEAVGLLHLGLDMEDGNRIVETLEQIYRFVLAELIRINLRNDRQAAVRLIEVLTPLRAAWGEVDRLLSSGASAEAAEPVVATQAERVRDRISVGYAA